MALQENKKRNSQAKEAKNKQKRSKNKNKAIKTIQWSFFFRNCHFLLYFIELVIILVILINYFTFFILTSPTTILSEIA